MASLRSGATRAIGSVDASNHLSDCGAVVVYVDSASTDNSVALAGSMNVEVVNLDMSIPFTAGGRNAGFERLMELDPSVRFVQFLDGDCETAEGWLDLAMRTLEERPKAAVVFGFRRERFPEHSIYNRIADIDWNMPIGRLDESGDSRRLRWRRDDACRSLPSGWRL